MISRSHRFHGYNSLRHVYRHGRMARGSQFAVKAALNPRRQTYRVAVVVSRKVNKSAVARNRMRRRLYELVRVRYRYNRLPEQPAGPIAAGAGFTA
jgi:ribonuclease P protein component